MNKVNKQISPMNSLSKNQVYLIGGILLFLMVVTRAGFVNHLQDASWAIFFLVGFYLRDSSIVRLGFPVFFLTAFAIDLAVIDAQGGVHYCFTPAYPFLIPAYATLWFGGKWFGDHYQENAMGFVKFAAVAIAAVTVCFLISNAGFYFFSEKFETMSMAEYISRVAMYLPMYLKTSVLYLGFAALLHIVVIQAKKLSGEKAHS